MASTFLPKNIHASITYHYNHSYRRKLLMVIRLSFRPILFIENILYTKIALEFLMYNVTHYHKVVVLDRNMARPFIEALLPLCTLSSMGVCCLLTHNSPF